LVGCFSRFKSKVGENKFEELPQKNVDFGGGLERLTAAANRDPDVFNTDLFADEIKAIEEVSGKSYLEANNKSQMRVISDHIKSATFLVNAGVLPSNKEKGYVLRRFLRRAAIKMRKLTGEFKSDDFSGICNAVVATYDGLYLSLDKVGEIQKVISEEMGKFNTTLERGLKETEKIQEINAKKAFDLFMIFIFYAGSGSLTCISTLSVMPWQ